MRKLVFCAAATALAVSGAMPVLAQRAAMTAADYARAEQFMGYTVTPLVYRSGVRGTWLPDDRAWYRVTTENGSESVLVDPVKGTKSTCDLPECIAGGGRGGRGAQQAAGGGRGAARIDVPSPDGKRTAYIKQWNLWVRDIATGQDTADEIKWSKFSDLTWAKDGRGFYYARYAEPAKGQQYQGSSRNQKIYFHRLGTPQSADRLIYSTPRQPGLYHGTSLSDDGKRLIITSSETGIGYQVVVIDVARPAAKARVLVPGFDDNYYYAGSVGPVLYFVTNKGAPKQKMVAIDASASHTGL